MVYAFLSYAREDEHTARRLYGELALAGVACWFDRESLLPGQIWKQEIRSAIQRSDYFVALLSRASVSKRGEFQAELKEALSVLQGVPESRAYFIPARLDDCHVTSMQIAEIHWVDLFPDWERGVSRILQTMGLHRDVHAIGKSGGLATVPLAKGTTPPRRFWQTLLGGQSQHTKPALSDLAELVMHAVHQWRERFEQDGIQVGIENQLVASRSVLIDPSSFLLVLQELFANAVRAMETAEARELTVRIRPLDDDGVAVDILDSGAGLAGRRPADRFFGPDGSMKSGGFGGLARARTLLLQWGGDLELTNRGDRQGARATLLIRQTDEK